MAVSKQLSDIYNHIHTELAPPNISKIIKEATSEHKATFDPSAAIQIGARFPDFELPNATGASVSLKSLLASGPVLITFYRGQWCPFCNIALMGLQKRLPDFKAAGAQLVAITPELPDTSLSTVEKNGLEFAVLSDVDNKLARQLGIIFVEPPGFTAVFEHIGLDFEKAYGAEAAKRGLDVPIPATFLLDREGLVKERYIEPNYHERLEPDVALKWVKSLNRIKTV